MRPSNGDSTTEQQERGPCGKELSSPREKQFDRFLLDAKAQESSLPQKRTDPHVLQLNNRQAVGLRQFEVGISRLDIGQKNNVVLFVHLPKNRFSVVREPVVTSNSWPHEVQEITRSIVTANLSILQEMDVRIAPFVKVEWSCC